MLALDLVSPHPQDQGQTSNPITHSDHADAEGVRNRLQASARLIQWGWDAVTAVSGAGSSQ